MSRFDIESTFEIARDQIIKQYIQNIRRIDPQRVAEIFKSGPYQYMGYNDTTTFFAHLGLFNAAANIYLSEQEHL